MAMVMRGFSPSDSHGGQSAVNNGVPAPGSQRHYPVVPNGTVQDGLVGSAGGMPMGLMEPTAAAAMVDPSFGTNGGYYPQQQPRPQPYRDFSRMPLEETTAAEEIPSGPGAGKEPPFPAKLHRILSNPEFQDYITWLPHGRSWRVLKPKAFEEKVIPLYFRHAKYASFMRQVNGWGFKRMTQGPDHNSYYHEMFLRGLPHLCSKMRRSSRTKNASMDSDAHPDFYRISMLAPLPGQTAFANSAAADRAASSAGSATAAAPPPAATAVSGISSETEGASSTKNKKSTQEGSTQPPTVPSASTTIGSPTSGSSLQQQMLQSQFLDASMLRKDAGGVVSPSFADAQLAAGWPQMQMVVGHAGIPAVPMAYPTDPMRAGQATAAVQASQYPQQLLAAGPGAALLPLGANGGLNMMYQNQALQSQQSLLAQIQAQMAQAQGLAPSSTPPAAASSASDEGNSAP